MNTNMVLLSLFLQDGSTFKVKYKFKPYFYAATKVRIRAHESFHVGNSLDGWCSAQSLVGN